MGDVKIGDSKQKVQASPTTSDKLEEGKNQNDYVYSLQGVVYHQGSFESGHYYARRK